MSSIWTPSGEYRPRDEPGEEQAGEQDREQPGDRGGQPGAEPPGAPPTAEEIAALRELHARLVGTPVADVIANHALGIFQLALVHLGVVTPPDESGRLPAPNLAAAGLAIDALAALVDGLGDRLGEHAGVLRDALTQAQMLFVEVSDTRPDTP